MYVRSHWLRHLAADRHQRWRATAGSACQRNGNAPTKNGQPGESWHQALSLFGMRPTSRPRYLHAAHRPLLRRLFQQNPRSSLPHTRPHHQPTLFKSTILNRKSSSFVFVDYGIMREDFQNELCETGLLGYKCILARVMTDMAVSTQWGVSASCRLRSASCGALLVLLLRGCAADVISTFPGGTPENAAKMAAPPRRQLNLLH